MSCCFRTLALAAALALPGCVIIDADRDDPGTLTVVWTIEGFQEPSDCAFYGVDRLELALYDIFDDPVVTRYPLCESFEISVRLPEGRFSADLTLVDSRNLALTDTQVVDGIDVESDEERVLAVDFPARSFR